MSVLTIGQLARAAGVGVETIRYYERRGLLDPPPRTPAGYRQYGDGDRWRLGFIRRAKDLGFTLTEIRELLADPERRPDDVVAAAQRTLVDVRARIEQLDATRARLERLVRTCTEVGDDADCVALATGATAVASPGPCPGQVTASANASSR